MSDRSRFEEKLIDYIEDAHALEQHARHVLEQEGLHGAPPMGEPGSMAGTMPPEPGTAA